MECNVVMDLIPLYIDDCCSEESTKVVKSHMERCRSCREVCESMRARSDEEMRISAPQTIHKIDQWKASVLQSVMLLVSFAFITAGVALEAATPVGLMNGFWALALVVPATGFMLSLTNWYFVRLYRSRKLFSNCSILATLGGIVCAYFWAVVHYELDLSVLLQGIFLRELLIGLALTAVFCVLSKLASNKFAKMVGKE